MPQLHEANLDEAGLGTDGRVENLVEILHHLSFPGRIHFQVHVKLDRLVMGSKGSAAGEEPDSQKTKKIVAAIHGVILPHPD